MPIYSICVPNYNMENTLKQALVSVLEQLDDEYEVLVVDDGSSDKSLDILDQLAQEYCLLRVIKLTRDSNRRLGETRNISVREARGQYVILHVDGDDVWEPYITDFVSVFHKLENCLGRNFLLSGQQINMGKRDFLLEHGPYRNIYHAEDRDMCGNSGSDQAILLCCCVNGAFNMLFLSLEPSFWHKKAPSKQKNELIFYAKSQ